MEQFLNNISKKEFHPTFGRQRELEQIKTLTQSWKSNLLRQSQTLWGTRLCGLQSRTSPTSTMPTLVYLILFKLELKLTASWILISNKSLHWWTKTPSCVKVWTRHNILLETTKITPLNRLSWKIGWNQICVDQWKFSRLMSLSRRKSLYRPTNKGIIFLIYLSTKIIISRWCSCLKESTSQCTKSRQCRMFLVRTTRIFPVTRFSLVQTFSTGWTSKKPLSRI